MKNKIFYIAASALFLSSGLVSCNDLDTFPEQSYVTASQKEEAVSMNPELASAGVVGISSTYPRCWSVYADAHNDFGWPALMMFLESIGIDFVSSNIGYNWFAYGASDYSIGTNNNYTNNMAWYLSYKIIKSSNDLIATIDPETTDPELMLFAAQGYANRAYAYFILAQLFQQTYVGHESLPCVPIITDLNSDQVAMDGGAPRASVQEVYDQILSDLDTAVGMLDRSGLPVTQIASTGSRRFVSLGAAYGLRARVNLVMNNWQAAASDAANAIRTSGCTPLSIEEASRPGFSNSDDHECMWAIYIQETDRCVTTGIVNYPSMMGSFNSNGYWTVGATRRINKGLFASIPTNDARKGWWLDSSKSSKNLTTEETKFVMGYNPDAYTTVKFGPYQGQVGTVTNANDFFLMRVEEMYLIQAEATAMAGDAAAGKNLLETFVKTYRNPSYTCNASTPEAVQNEVWMQRRIELWGEGFAYLDLLRLNKGLDRRGGGWEAVWCYNVPAPLKPLLIPNGEMQANKNIGANNDAWATPQPVDDI